MPVEDMEEQGLSKIPDLGVAQIKFQLQHLNYPNPTVKQQLKDELMKAIETQQMGPFYRLVCKDLKWTEDNNLIQRLAEQNEKTLKELDEKIADAAKNQGESELRDTLLAKAEYLTKIGMKDEAIDAVRKTMEKTVGLGNRMDLIFHNIRLGLFFMDHQFIQSNLERANTMMEEGGDWDRRNRLKVYEGLYSMSIRNFGKAADLFLETVSTFTSYELMDYKQFVKYTVYMGMIALDRRKLLDKIVKGSEICEVLHGCPEVHKYLMSFYNCHYGDFFQCLSEVELVAKQDRYMHAHYAYYIREMKIKAYAQLLESYRSLTLDYMAEAFGVTEDYMDADLSRYIADGRIHCKIDKVRGIVITNRPDTKNAQYQSVIKHGDILLNRVQKLSRVINI